MLFTGKGDKGTTKTYGCKERVSKNSPVAEALGSLDEINSFLGLVKVASKKAGFVTGEQSFEYLVHEVQQTLFMIQAEVAGYPMKLEADKITKMEEVINAIEKELPPIKTFFISGGSELAALFDVSRTMARRAERRVVGVVDEGKVPLGENTLAYLNRLSSLLYALARLSNHKYGISEEPPKYK